MHRGLLTAWCAFVALTALSAAALAHHSFSGEFQPNTTIVVEGDITQVSFRNPHVYLYMDVVKDGVTTNWGVALQNIAIMTKAGISRDSFRIGDHIRVTGNPGIGTTKKVYVVKIEKDGKVFAMFRDGTPARAATTSEVVSATSNTSSIADKLVGDWAFDVDKRLPGAPLHLKFSKTSDGVSAMLDNEVLDVGFAGDTFVITLPRENAAGHKVELQLTGQIDGETLSGKIAMTKGTTSLQNLDATSFNAKRSNANAWDHSTFRPIAPVDLSGIWQRTIGVGPLGRTNPQLTDAGQKQLAYYRRGQYDPALRCISVGPMRKYADPGSVEILPSLNRLTLLYSSNHDARRVYFDRKDFNPDREPDVMGESIGRWDGNVLVIETRSLSPSVLTHDSEPTSANARIVERFWLEDDGHLTMQATLIDPEYYQHPVIRRTQWVRAKNQLADMEYNVCDPDSFYQEMFHDGVLADYFKNRPE